MMCNMSWLYFAFETEVRQSKPPMHVQAQASVRVGSNNPNVEITPTSIGSFHRYSQLALVLVRTCSASTSGQPEEP
jgi:hypothetical protein